MRKMKKLLVSILALLLLVTALPISVMAQDDTATSTTAATKVADSGWIEINSAEEFLKIGKDAAYPSTGSYYLADDIDFTDYNGEGTGVYVSTTSLLTTFDGTLDGRGKAIKGFKIEGTNAVAMIAKLGSQSKTTTITNLNIGTATSPIEITSNIDANANVAILAAEAGNDAAVVFIDNVHVNGNIQITNDTNRMVRISGFIAYGCCDITVQDSSFNGELFATGKTVGARYTVGGIIGDTDCYGNKGRQIVIKRCDVDADSTIQYTDGANVGNHPYAIGGLIGRGQSASTFVDECNVKGELIGKKIADLSKPEEFTPVGTIGGIIGNIYAYNAVKDGYSNSVLFVATDCTTDVTMTGAKTNDVYNLQNETDTLKERVYVRGCASQNTLARDFGDFGEVDGNAFDADYNYVWLIDEVDDLAKIGKADATKTDHTYAMDGLYRVDEDLSLGNATNYVISGYFGGVFDGNGKSVTATTMTRPFFQRLADGYSASNNCNDVMIFDLDLGSPDEYIEMTNTAKNCGVLGSYAGDANINYRTMVSNVNIYANIRNAMTGDSFLGGFIGTSRYVGYYDCNMYGSFVSKGITKTTANTFIGGFVGNADQAKSKNVFCGCNNFADIYTEETGTSNAIARVGGFIGDVSASAAVAFLNSNNFGDVTVASTQNYTEMNAGGFAGSVKPTNVAGVINCANFGDISSTQNASGFISFSNQTVSFSDCMQAGNVTAATKAVDFASAEQIANTLNCDKVTNIIAMDNGAAVRLASNTGLRFTSTVSADVMARLADILSAEQTVVYGTLIAPDAFIDGEFTHDALDAYAENNNFSGAAYVDVPSVDGEGNGVWFKDEAGRIAGSITGLPAKLYKTAFSGVAYMTVKVGDTPVFTTYASNAQSRTIYDVAKAALDDTNAEVATVGGYTYDQAIQVGETYFVDGEAKVFAEGDAAVYSCYPKSQRDTLNKIVADADSAIAG